MAETREPIPAPPGQPERVDDEWERQGTANLLMVFEPLAGRRQGKVTERRTAVDVAHLLREVSDEPYPHAETLVLGMDNLHTQPAGVLVRGLRPDRGAALHGACRGA